MSKHNDFRCLRNDTLPMDTACVSVINGNEKSYTLYSMISDCYHVSAMGQITHSCNSKNKKYFNHEIFFF